MNNRYITFLFTIILILTGCTNFSYNENTYKDDMDLYIQDIYFDSDYKQFYVNVKMKDSIAVSLLSSDTAINFKVNELSANNFQNPRTQPILKKVENLRMEQISQKKMNILILADITLDSTNISRQKRAVRNINKYFPNNNINIAFMNGSTVSETMNVTDYVLDKYFKKEAKDKFLYRSIYTKYEELKNDSSFVNTMIWDSVSNNYIPRQKVMFVLSDGKVYNHNKPIDPQHFMIKNKIVENCDSAYNIPIFYFNLQNNQTGMEDSDLNEESSTFLDAVCQKSGGKYFNISSQTFLLGDILRQLNRSDTDYKFTLVNPDQKTYRGSEHKLQIGCYRNDSLIASDNVSYYIGSIYKPIIVNGLTTFQVIVQGSLLGILTIIVLYLIFQLLTPAIKYMVFKKKYITQYKGKNTSKNGILIGDTCYFCKAPFEIGEEIVVKCSHILHKSCWDENEYKCPEYGKNCKTGRHYYNPKNLFDSKNASFYLSWIIAGAIAGLIAWISFIANSQKNENLLLMNLIHIIFNVDLNSPKASVLIEEYGSHLFFLPFYGLNIGFFLSLCLSILTGHGKWLWKRSLITVAKAIAGGILSYLSFFLGCIISISLNLTNNSFLVDWIPWMLSGFIIAFIVSYGTDIKLKKALVGATISIIFGLGSMYLWSFAYSIQIDTREFQLLSYMIYCIGFAISVAATSPKSERYFLSVEGPIKKMDIAIYKWMNSSTTNKHISIGKSVNCDLQMTWDITSRISPVQAEIRMINGHLYLIALDDGVIFNQKNLNPNIKKRLYHGYKFIIGKTIFTYIEKDL